jgi:hypothetical protein
MRILCADARLAGKPHHDWKEGYELMYAFRRLGHTCDVAGPNGVVYTELDIPRIASFYHLIIVTENYPFSKTDTVPRGWRWWNWGQISTPKLFWAIDTHVNDYRDFIRQGRFNYVAFTNRRNWIEYGLTNSFVLHYALSRSHQFFNETHPKQYDCIFIGNLNVSSQRKYLCDKFGIQHMNAYGGDYFRTMKKAKICFNKSISDDINAKYFEIMGSGSFMLTNYNQEIIDFMDESVREDLKACMYKTEEEIGEKIVYYLEHEDEREAIAKRLHDHVWTHHTWENRAIEIMRHVQNVYRPR